MTETTDFRTRYRDYRPSKTAWFWSCAAVVALTIFGGFTWGGWTTASNAEEMRNQAVQDARADLAARVCSSRFLASVDAASRLKEFQSTNSWARKEMLQEGGFMQIGVMDEPIRGMADRCAQRLINAELPAPPPDPAQEASDQQKAG